MKEYKVITKGMVFVNGSAISRFSAGAERPANLIVITENGELLAETVCGAPLKRFKAADWGKYVELYPISQENYVFGVVERSDGIAGGYRVNAAVIRDNCETYLFDCENVFYAEKLKSSGYYEFFYSNDYPVCGLIYGDDKRYITVVSTQTAKKIYENCGESISADGNGFLVTRRLSDTAGRTVTERYAFGNEMCLLTDKKFSYDRKFSDLEELLPYQFLEALLADDEQAAALCLSTELKDKLTEIREYIGDFSGIPQLPPFITEKNLAAIQRNDGSVEVFEFFIKDGEIVNIDNHPLA